MSSPAEEESEEVTFESLGISKALCQAIDHLGWKQPTEIQSKAIPEALSGRDIIGLAETGSGKTGAFAIPILDALLASPSRYFALILSPTRELAFQTNEVFEALGASMALSIACIVGGIDFVEQSIALAKRPHVITATPGRLVDHLQNTKGFNLRNIKFLVLDEADRMLSMDFEKKVAKLQKASLQNPVRLEVSTQFQTPKALVQQYLFMPAKWKDCYLAYLLDDLRGQSTILFVATCQQAERTTLLLRNLGWGAVCLHGQMSQAKRLGALNKFKTGGRNLLIATDVAARGLDIPEVDLVVNFDLPVNAKDYVHRVGRTARAGRAGRAVSFVTQYDVEAYQRLEALLEQKLPAYPAEEEAVLVLLERVNEAQRMACKELKERETTKGGGKGGKGKKRKREDGGHRSGDADQEVDA
eukprot:gene10333-11436_t